MHIRPATPADFSSTASMAVDSFWNDELYVYTNPLRSQYPDHFRDLFLRQHRQSYWSPGYIFLVAVTDDGDDGHEPEGKVVGYAIWERRGERVEARRWQKLTYWALIQCMLLAATEQYLAFFRADKSIDYERMQHFCNESKDDFPAITELWKLQNLCVHVDYQRRGLGSMLIGWGKDKAEREGCPIGLQSSMAARPTYVKNGFQEYGKMPIRDSPIIDLLYLWEPKGLEGRWGMKRDYEGYAMRES